MDVNESIDITTLSLPDEILRLIDDAPVYESSGHSGAKTVYIERGGGMYLKIAERGSLRSASVMQAYFNQHMLSSPLLEYLSLDKDYLLTASLKGEDAVSDQYLSEPKRLCELFALILQNLHSINTVDCPIKKVIELPDTVVFNQDKLDYLTEFIGIANKEKALDEIKMNSGVIKNDVLLHGDYCLPNVMLNDWEFEGFIDLADAGIGDRHYDLAQGLFTLRRNLSLTEYGWYFLDAYGWENIDKERLRVCALLAAME